MKIEASSKVLFFITNAEISTNPNNFLISTFKESLNLLDFQFNLRHSIVTRIVDEKRRCASDFSVELKARTISLEEEIIPSSIIR